MSWTSWWLERGSEHQDVQAAPVVVPTGMVQLPTGELVSLAEVRHFAEAMATAEASGALVLHLDDHAALVGRDRGGQTTLVLCRRGWGRKIPTRVTSMQYCPTHNDGAIYRAARHLLAEASPPPIGPPPSLVRWSTTIRTWCERQPKTVQLV